MNKNRLKIEAYKLQVYLNAIREMHQLTDAQWIRNQIHSNNDFVPRSIWINYLQQCALTEANKLALHTLKNKKVG